MTIQSLEEAQRKDITIRVNGRILKKMDKNNLENLQVFVSVQERKHLETEGNITKEMRQDTKLGVTEFEKEASEYLKEIIEEKLRVSKFEAKRRILKKQNFCQKPKGSGKDVKAKKREEVKRKKEAMKRTTCLRQCQICQHLAGLTTIVNESSMRSHFRAFHETENSYFEMDKRFIPVVKILHK